MARQQYCVTGARHTYFQSLEEGNPRSSRSASEVAALVRELPLIALSVLSRNLGPDFGSDHRISSCISLGPPIIA